MCPFDGALMPKENGRPMGRLFRFVCLEVKKNGDAREEVDIAALCLMPASGRRRGRHRCWQVREEETWQRCRQPREEVGRLKLGAAASREEVRLPHPGTCQREEEQARKKVTGGGWEEIAPAVNQDAAGRRRGIRKLMRRKRLGGRD